MNKTSTRKKLTDKLSIVIPAYNEEGAIANTIERCKKLVGKHGISEVEIIVVNDASTDKTAVIARELGIHVIEHPSNSGYGRSLKSGIMAASYDMIMITDADGTYPVEQVEDLLPLYRKGFQLVVGARSGQHYHESWFKSPLRKILRFLVEFTAGEKIEDINSGFRLFSKQEVMPYLIRLCNTFSFTTSLTLSYLMTGKFVAHTKIDYEKRVGRSKVRLIRDSLRTLQYIVQMVLYYNPIKIFLILCAFNIVLGLFGFLLSIITKITIGYYIGLFSIFSTMLWFAVGLLSEQLKQIMIDKSNSN